MSSLRQPLQRRQDEDLNRAMATQGYAVLRQVVPRPAIEAALREVHLALVRNGPSAETIARWLRHTNWFPHLKWHPTITQLAAQLPRPLREGELCDPQIVLHPPDTCQDMPLAPHLDEEPHWAEGRRYRRIIGIALSPGHSGNGGLHVWPFGSTDPEPVELEAGDVVAMNPTLPHTSGLNREGAIRYAVYLRYLEP